MKHRLLSFLALSLLAGCFTLSESEFPQVTVQKLPCCREIKLQLSGFEATLTSYAAVYGYETMMGGCYGGYWGPGYYYPATVSTTTFVPQVASDKTFLNRATDTLERSGYLLKTSSPDYRVEVDFAGPYEKGTDTAKNIAWNIFTIFTADRVMKTWTAKLKIYDLRTGKLLITQDYAQEYGVFVWGPIPFFSPLSSDKMSYNYWQSWALTALTDQAVAGVTDFFTKQAN